MYNLQTKCTSDTKETYFIIYTFVIHAGSYFNTHFGSFIVNIRSSYQIQLYEGSSFGAVSP